MVVQPHNRHVIRRSNSLYDSGYDETETESSYSSDSDDQVRSLPGTNSASDEKIFTRARKKLDTTMSRSSRQNSRSSTDTGTIFSSSSASDGISQGGTPLEASGPLLSEPVRTLEQEDQRHLHEIRPYPKKSAMKHTNYAFDYNSIVEKKKKNEKSYNSVAKKNSNNSFLCCLRVASMDKVEHADGSWGISVNYVQVVEVFEYKDRYTRRDWYEDADYARWRAEAETCEDLFDVKYGPNAPGGGGDKNKKLLTRTRTRDSLVVRKPPVDDEWVKRKSKEIRERLSGKPQSNLSKLKSKNQSSNYKRSASG